MSPTITLQSSLPLPHTTQNIPVLGFGIYQSHGPTCVQSCLTALKAGYTHFDSAQYYANEVQLASAVQKSGIDRSSLFLTTKILFPGSDAQETYNSVKESCEKLGGYADLFLIHSPNGGNAGVKLMWQALERARKEGIVKSIGVSNFGIKHIDHMRSYAEMWPPSVNQIELHPWCQQREIVDYCNEQKIVVEAYCPLVRNEKADDETLRKVAKKYGKSTGQILIRWSLQRGWVPLPKSDTPSRIVANADISDFEIEEKDMKSLDALDEGANGAIVQAVSN